MDCYMFSLPTTDDEQICYWVSIEFNLQLNTKGNNLSWQIIIAVSLFESITIPYVTCHTL
jgi:hypothetical protein